MVSTVQPSRLVFFAGAGAADLAVMVSGGSGSLAYFAADLVVGMLLQMLVKAADVRIWIPGLENVSFMLSLSVSHTTFFLSLRSENKSVRERA